jgi:hypothetical protein
MNLHSTKETNTSCQSFKNQKKSRKEINCHYLIYRFFLVTTSQPSSSTGGGAGSTDFLGFFFGFGENSMGIPKTILSILAWSL